MIEKIQFDDMTKIFDAIRKHPRYFFPVSKPSLDQVNLFLLGFIHGQNIAQTTQRKVDFTILSRFSAFVDKKLESNRKVINDWWVEIRMHYPENQMEKFFELWDEYCATIN